MPEKEPLTETPDTSDSLYDRGITYLSGDVDEETAGNLIGFIIDHNLSDTPPNQLVILVSSWGGDGTAAFAITDIMAGSQIPIITVALGKVASAGLIVFMAGHHRMSTKNTLFLSHQYSWTREGKQHDLKAFRKAEDMLGRIGIDHYKRYTGLDEETISSRLLGSSDVWLTAEEAREFKLVDEIVDTIVFGK